MQAKQYEERILKLQDALEMQKLKNMSQLGRIRTLEEQLSQTQDALEDERNEKEAILKNRRTNRLLLELQEERVQRLQDLEEIYAKDKQLAALTNEVTLLSKGATDVQEELTHKDAEVTGLRASLRCSAKLLQKAEKDFLVTHQELEDTHVKLLECKRKMTEKETAVRVWIERYEQVMLDLHVAQFRLTQLARDASSKDAALTRGYAIDLEKSSTEVAHLKPRTHSKVKHVAVSDRAVRKFRQDLIPQRSQSLTASIANLHSLYHNQSSSDASTSRMHVHDTLDHSSRGCFQCSSAPNLRTDIVCTRKDSLSRSEPVVSEHISGSKYLGYGLGLLKKNHIVQSTNL